MTSNLDMVEPYVKHHLHKDAHACPNHAELRLGEPAFAPYLCRTLPPPE